MKEDDAIPEEFKELVIESSPMKSQEPSIHYIPANASPMADSDISLSKYINQSSGPEEVDDCEEVSGLPRKLFSAKKVRS